MYPFKSAHHTYPRNAWYVGAFSSEVSRTPFERTILGERTVFYRTNAGAPVALDGRCAHRRFPLAAGHLDGDAIVCGYHGWQYDAGGACTAIPSQARVPAACKIRSYPVVERWNWIWIWTGDPALADPSGIPDHTADLKVTHPEWEAVIGGHTLLNARCQLMIENLLDLSHLSFVHDRSIGTSAVAATPVELETFPGGLIATRRMLNGAAPPVFQQLMNFAGPADRTTSSTFFAPGITLAGSRFTKPVTNGTEPQIYGDFRVLHVVTPETPTTAHYFWGWTRSFALGDDSLTEQMTSMLYNVFLEDKAAIERQELAIGDEDRSDFSAASDAPALRGRQLLEAMMDGEREQRTLTTRSAGSLP
jgi:phenylpropionate dioxygenase-like ring-hydroxylating dioxygenase large terminal subunit